MDRRNGLLAALLQILLRCDIVKKENMIFAALLTRRGREENGMDRNRWIKPAAAALALLTVFMGVAFAAGTPLCGQTHVAEQYAEHNAVWEKRFFEGCGRALDGTDGTPDLCLPGLSEADNMVPQGIACYPAKNQMLISAYSKSDAGSVIFALDMTDGHLAAEYHIIRRSGNPAAAHFGGIAVSDHNLYIADYDSTISYVPLSALNAEDGAAADVTLAGTTDCAAFMNGANTSFVGCGNGLLWTGNFYDALDKSYQTKGAEDCGTVIVCFALEGTDSASEWESLFNGSPYSTLRVPATVSKVQGAYLLGDTAYLSTSSTRSLPGTLVTARVDYEHGRILTQGMRRTQTLAMAEDLEVADGTLYTLSESGAWPYRGGDGGRPSRLMTDTVWSVDLARLEAAQANPAAMLLQRILRFFLSAFDWLNAVC